MGMSKRLTILTNIEEYIIPPSLGNQAGLLGAIALVVRNEGV